MNKQEIQKAINHLTMLRRLDSGEKRSLYDTAITALEHQLTDMWIPITERLPEETGDYLCTVEWYGTSTKKLLIGNGCEIGRRIMMVHFLNNAKSFKECELFCTYKVIAWKNEEPWKETV